MTSKRRKTRPEKKEWRPVNKLADMDGRNQVFLVNHLGGEWKYVDELVMSSFKGPCPKDHEIKHLDGDIGNDNLSNLAYVKKEEKI
jgi:hypothetical protein